MEAMNNSKQSTQLPQSISYDDEIDLFELAQDIWQERILIIGITFFAAVLAVIYALIATPIYQTSSIIKLAKIKDLDELNGLGIYSLSPAESLIRVGAALESHEVRFDYFKNNLELFAAVNREDISLEQNFERFNRESIRVIKPDSKKDKDTESSPYVGIQLQYAKGLNGPEIVNGLVRYAINVERDNLTEDLKVIINNRLENVNRSLVVLRAGYEVEKEVKITSLIERDNLKRLQLQDELKAIRITLKNSRENRIKLLDEAIVIAKSLGIKKPTTPSGLSESINTSGNIIKTEVTNQQNPLYFMGIDALEAERSTLLARKNDDFTSSRIVEINQELKLLERNRQIEVLKSRENEDFFLAELADKQKEISRLKGLKVNMDNLKMVSIDQYAVQPSNAIKPKKKLIVVIGVILGGMLGVIFALARSAIRKRKLRN